MNMLNNKLIKKTYTVKMIYKIIKIKKAIKIIKNAIRTYYTKT